MSRSITGQYVVTHPATKTVIVGDDLEATFERMRALTDAEPVGPSENATEPAAPQPIASSRARLLPWAVLAVLPFLWLGALHVSLGRLVSELRAAAPAANDAATVSELRARLERLERQLEERPTMSRPRNRPTARPTPATADTKADAPTDDDAKTDDAKTDDATAPAAKGEAKDDADLEHED